jgi:hypothetical protein
MTTDDQPDDPHTVSRRPFGKRLLMWVRRGHLYLGLFLFPWAILYGVTGFLFNHPTAFSDVPAVSFSASTLVGTSAENLPTPQEIAEQVVSRLNEVKAPPKPFELAGPAKFGREFAFGSVKTANGPLSFLIDPRTGSGTVRETPPQNVDKPPTEPAPFAVGPAPSKDKNNQKQVESPRITHADTRAIVLDRPLHERIQAAVPIILERTGFSTGEVTITSVPDVVFPLTGDGKTWTATYNPMTGSVTGKPAAAERPAQLSWRRFLLRLHLAHGYPSEPGSKFGWAVVVDLMAATMCFWGLSGLVMWWQIKATRRLGAIVLVVSTVTAAVLAVGMHSVLTN